MKGFNVLGKIIDTCYYTHLFNGSSKTNWIPNYKM